jgi:signal transduction histidine kinase
LGSRGTGDGYLFEQMLLQVLDNAWKYPRTGASIRVSGEGGVYLIDSIEAVKDRHRVEGSGLELVIAKNIAGTGRIQ